MAKNIKANKKQKKQQKKQAKKQAGNANASNSNKKGNKSNGGGNSSSGNNSGVKKSAKKSNNNKVDNKSSNSLGLPSSWPSIFNGLNCSSILGGNNQNSAKPSKDPNNAPKNTCPFPKEAFEIIEKLLSLGNMNSGTLVALLE